MTNASGVPTAFRGQRARTFVVLGVIVAAFGILSAWNITHLGVSDFYASAARSMSENWRAFFFGAFNPAATITLDKLSGFLVPQAISARIFGFHQWSLALPQVIEGMITVIATYVIGARWRDAATGLLAAGAVSLTPLLVSMFGHTMEDGMLTMCLTLAFMCWQSSLVSCRFTPLIAAAVWVGIGFQAKMMQAWVILPAMVIGYLLARQHPVASRMWRAALVLIGSLVASVLWMTVVQLIPASSRPYFDGSTNNNVFSMVFGYNGFDRFVPNLVPGAAPIFVPQSLVAGGLSTNPVKLLLPIFATQVGWLYPLALIGVVAVFVPVVARRVGVFRTDGVAGSGSAFGPVGVALSVWLASAGALMSVAKVPHTAYFAALSVQVGLLAAIGFVQAVALYRQSRGVGQLWLPIVIGVQTAWSVWRLSATGVAPAWLTTTVLVLGAAACGGLALGIRRSLRRRLVGGTLVCAVLSAAIAPAVWSGSVLDRDLDGTVNDAYAGPRIDEPASRFDDSDERSRAISFGSFGLTLPSFRTKDFMLSPERAQLVRYVQARIEPGAIAIVTTSWFAATPYILDAGVSVLPLGGFSRGLPTPTLQQVKALVAAGELRYFLLPSSASIVSGSGGSGGSQPQLVRSWVVSRCTVVPASAYGGGGGVLAQQVLWSCGG